MYLDLADAVAAPLATLDEPLRKAAKKLGVKLLGRSPSVPVRRATCRKRIAVIG